MFDGKKPCLCQKDLLIVVPPLVTENLQILAWGHGELILGSGGMGEAHTACIIVRELNKFSEFEDISKLVDQGFYSSFVACLQLSE